MQSSIIFLSCSGAKFQPGAFMTMFPQNGNEPFGGFFRHDERKDFSRWLAEMASEKWFLLARGAWERGLSQSAAQMLASRRRVLYAHGFGGALRFGQLAVRWVSRGLVKEFSHQRTPLRYAMLCGIYCTEDGDSSSMMKYFTPAFLAALRMGG